MNPISQRSEKYKEFCTYIKYERIKDMKFMLDRGFEINEHYYDWEGNEEARILFVARHSSNEIFEFLLERGADPNFLLGKSSRSILQELINTEKNKYKIEIILKYGADPEGSSEVATLLEHCMRYDTREYTDILLRFGADPEKMKNRELRDKFYEMYSINIKPAKR